MDPTIPTPQPTPPPVVHRPPRKSADQTLRERIDNKKKRNITKQWCDCNSLYIAPSVDLNVTLY